MGLSRAWELLSLPGDGLTDEGDFPNAGITLDQVLQPQRLRLRNLWVPLGAGTPQPACSSQGFPTAPHGMRLSITDDNELMMGLPAHRMPLRVSSPVLMGTGPQNGLVRSITYFDMDGQRKVRQSVLRCQNGECQTVTREVHPRQSVMAHETGRGYVAPGIADFFTSPRSVTSTRGNLDMPVHSSGSTMKDYGRDLANWFSDRLPGWRLSGDSPDEVRPHSIGSSSTYKFVSINGDGKAEALHTHCVDGKCNMKKHRWVTQEAYRSLAHLGCECIVLRAVYGLVQCI